MKSICTVGLIATLLLLSDHVNGLNLRVTGRKRTGRHLSRRAGGIELQDGGGLEYYANITVGDQGFQVLVDSGSTDMFLAGSVAHSNATGHNTTIPIVQKAQRGPIRTASAVVAGFTIPDQMYVEIEPDEFFPEGQGVLGFGPLIPSSIWNEMNLTDSATPVVDRIFLQNVSIPHYVTVLLGRSTDPVNLVVDGNITIGELVDGLTDIESQPKIPVTNVPVDNARNQHFQVLLDEDSIIGPDGKFIPMITDVEQTEDNTRTTVVFDTGSSFTLVPSYVAQTIYGGLEGAELRNITDQGLGLIWSLPCTNELNVTVNLGGQSYPIHPLDMIIDPTLISVNVTNSAGERLCLGTWVPLTFNKGGNITFDFVFGMSFLRNTYTLFEYGNLTAGGADTNAYMQFLSTTNPEKAHSEFVAVHGKNSTDVNRMNARSEVSGHGGRA